MFVTWRNSQSYVFVFHCMSLQLSIIALLALVDTPFLSLASLYFGLLCICSQSLTLHSNLSLFFCFSLFFDWCTFSLAQPRFFTRSNVVILSLLCCRAAKVPRLALCLSTLSQPFFSCLRSMAAFVGQHIQPCFLFTSPVVLIQEELSVAVVCNVYGRTMIFD